MSSLVILTSLFPSSFNNSKIQNNFHQIMNQQHDHDKSKHCDFITNVCVCIFCHKYESKSRVYKREREKECVCERERECLCVRGRER